MTAITAILTLFVVTVSSASEETIVPVSATAVGLASTGVDDASMVTVNSSVLALPLASFAVT